MLAELHGKISHSGSNLRNTSEDNLTGNVFGALRYASFNQVMKPLLISSLSSWTESALQEAQETFNKVNLDFWANNIKFWPYDEEGELDVLLQFDSVVVGIEVKYNSAMSDQESDTTGDLEKIGVSKKQLDRESRIVKKLAGNRDVYLILLARKQFAKDTVKITLDAGNIETGVKLFYIGWEDFLEALKKEKNKQENDFTRLILDDLIELLVLKCFEKFKSFDNAQADIIRFENGYYEFSDEFLKKLESFSFLYEDNVSEEEFYEYANGN